MSSPCLTWSPFKASLPCVSGRGILLKTSKSKAKEVVDKTFARNSSIFTRATTLEKQGVQASLYSIDPKTFFCCVFSLSNAFQTLLHFALRSSVALHPMLESRHVNPQPSLPQLPWDARQDPADSFWHMYTHVGCRVHASGILESDSKNSSRPQAQTTSSTTAASFRQLAEAPWKALVRNCCLLHPHLHKTCPVKVPDVGRGPIRLLASSLDMT